MKITLGEATKLIGNIVENYSQRYAEKAPTGKKVNSIKEITTLSHKMMLL